jgi:protein-disulfide isomerase
MASREEQKRRAREARLAEEQRVAAAEQRRRRLMILGGVALAAIVVVVVAIAISSSGGGGGGTNVSAGKPASGGAAVQRLYAGIPQSNLVLGKSSAPVTLVEYIDLKCPVCQAFETRVFPSLLRDYVRRGRLRVEVRVQDFVGNEEHDSEDAARMALAAGLQDRLYQFASLFYRHQGNENEAYVTDSFVTSIGKAVPGLDVNQALQQRSSSKVTRELQAASSAFGSNGFTGTPSFQLGTTGGSLKPYQPHSYVDAAEFERAIDNLLGT